MEKNLRKERRIRRKKIISIVCMTAVIAAITIVVLGSIEDTVVNKAWRSLTGADEGITVTYEDTLRDKLNFNFGWKFSIGEGVNNARSTHSAQNVVVIPDASNVKPYEANYTINSNNLGLNNEIWEEVSLPHTYNDTDTFDTFVESGYNGDRSTYSGTAWYKKDFFIPSDYQGKKIFIEFEAARQAAKVYLNGNRLTGTYENGFIPFGYDLTPYINYGETNHITVMVDNTYPYIMEGTSDAVSWHDTHWHPNYGGLYRNTFLYVVEPVHLTLPLYSFVETEGTYVYTSDETSATARINIESQVQNETSDNKTVKLVAYVRDMDGTAVLEIQGDVMTLTAGQKTTICISDTLQNVKRWSTDYPYLYTVECKLLQSTDGVFTVIDNNETQIGVRTFRFTNDYGLFLNEHYIKLHGWGQKTTNEWAGLGAAYPDWMQDSVLKLMKDAGSNFIRWGHVAGSPTQISASDKYGIITLQPGVDGEGETVGGAYTTNTYRLRTDAFRDMLIYFRNSPSIFIWEMGNQIMPASVAATMESYIQRYDHGNRTYATQNASGDYSFNNTESRPNTGTYNATISRAIRLSGVRRGIDVSMVPYVDIGITTEGAGGMNTSTYGNKPQVEGEYNRLEARRGVWDKSTTGYENFTNKVNSSSDTAYVNVTSESFATYQIKSFIDMIGKISHSGGANWIFSDSISHGRVGSEVARASGEVDGVMLPKEAYWVDKVIFSDRNSAHIIGHWNYATGIIKDVYVAGKATGATQAVLTVTNTSGTSTTYNGVKSVKYLWTFSNVAYESGTISVELKNDLGTVLASDSITTHSNPTSLRITPQVGPQGLLADGEDIVLMDVEILDENGDRCETFDGVRDNIYTYFTVNNQSSTTNKDKYCEWRGGYNSGIEYTIGKKYLYIESGITRVALRTTMTPGPISVTATTTLENGTVLTDTCTVNSLPINNTNGYSEMMNPRLAYSLTGLQASTLGTGTLPTEEESIVTAEYDSALVESVSYTGESSFPWSLEQVLENNALAYSDVTTTFTSIPYKYMNAEYLKLPSVDNGALAVDLINFAASQDIYVMVFRDPAVENPEWLRSYTLTNDIVTTSDGKMYKVYIKEVAAGTGVTMAGNGDTAQIGSSGAMNIIAFKAKTDIDNNIFFDETFETSQGVPSLKGWLYNMATNTGIVPEDHEGISAVQIQDANTAGMAVMYKKFAALSGKVKLSYKIQVASTLNSTSIINNYIRLFLHNGPANSDINARTHVNMEVYLHANTTLMYRTETTGIANKNIKTGITLDEWHTYEYEANLKTAKFTTKIDNIPIDRTFEMYNSANQYTNHIIIGSGNSSKNNFYVSYVKVEPIKSDAITAITVNGTPIPEFDVMTKAYLVKSTAGSNSQIQTVNRDSDVTSTVTFNEDHTKAEILVTDAADSETLAYTVYLDNRKANKTELKSIISYIEGLDEDCYTVATWGALEDEYEVAVLGVTNESLSYDNIQNIILRLEQRIDALRINIDAVRNKYYSSN